MFSRGYKYPKHNTYVVRSKGPNAGGGPYSGPGRVIALDGWQAFCQDCHDYKGTDGLLGRRQTSKKSAEAIAADHADQSTKGSITGGKSR